MIPAKLFIKLNHDKGWIAEPRNRMVLNLSNVSVKFKYGFKENSFEAMLTRKQIAQLKK